jgi:hypothetical protein
VFFGGIQRISSFLIQICGIKKKGSPKFNIFYTGDVVCVCPVLTKNFSQVSEQLSPWIHFQLETSISVVCQWPCLITGRQTPNHIQSSHPSILPIKP